MSHQTIKIGRLVKGVEGTNQGESKTPLSWIPQLEMGMVLGQDREGKRRVEGKWVSRTHPSSMNRMLIIPEQDNRAALLSFNKSL